MREHGGKVLSVQNDSLLAAFAAGAPAQFAEQRAARRRRRCSASSAPLGERWQTEYGLPAAVALGVHLGETVFGMAGPQGAQQYVAFGDCVSIAERLVHRARAGEIVLSLDVMKALGAAVATLGAEELPPLELAQAAADPDLRHGAGDAAGLYLGGWRSRVPRGCLRRAPPADARRRRRACGRR